MTARPAPRHGIPEFIAMGHLDASDLSFQFVPTKGVRLHVAQTSGDHGRLVVPLHGFPEFWYGWRNQIPALAEAGFRVWAPDQRGGRQTGCVAIVHAGRGE